MQVNWQSLGGTNFLPRALNPGEPMLAFGTNLDGRLELFVAAGAIWHLWQDSPSGPWTSPNNWTSRGTPPGITLSRPAVGRNRDGRLEVFALGSDGAIWHTWQAAPNNGWNPPNNWVSRGKPPGVNLGAPAVTSNADSRLEVFAAGSDGAIWHTWQVAPNNGWIAPNNWTSRGKPGRPINLTSPSVYPNIDGRLELCAAGSDGAIWHTSQVSANNGWASGWLSQGTAGEVRLSAPTIIPNSDARLDIFAAGSDRSIYHTAQTAASNGWQPPGVWSSLGRPANTVNLLSAPVVLHNQGGLLELVALYDDNTVDRIQQLQLSGPWPAPGLWASPLDGTRPVSQPALGRNQNGLLDCAVVSAGSEVFHVTQQAIGQW